MAITSTIYWAISNSTLSFSSSSISGTYSGSFSGTTRFESAGEVPWYSYRSDITAVNFATEIVPQYTKYWFIWCNNLTTINNISNLDTSLTEDMRAMFNICESLTSLDLSSFDTSNVTDMGYMFSGCESLTSLDLSSFDTSSVTDMGWVFTSCRSLTSLDLSSFDTSNVTDMGHMFYACRSLTSLDLSSFDTSNVASMYWTFRDCNNLETIYVSSLWSTALVTSSGNMFTNCSSIVGGNGTTYDSSHTDSTYARIDTTSTPGYFTGPSHTVSFDMQSHGTQIASQTVSYGGTATEPTAPTETGYTFGGWYEEAACTNLFDFTTAITSNKTLYAKWTATSYSITYDLDGGTVATANPTSYTIETASFTLNNPTKTDYDFDGWTGTGLSAETLTVTIPQGSTGDRSYTANYSAQTINHTVTFVMNGHGTNPGAQTVADGGTATRPTDPTEAHWTFGGWYADSALETAFDFSAAIYEDKTIYAKWTELPTYTLTFDMQSHGTQIDSQTKHTDESFTRPTDPAAEGYTFGGWFQESACTTAFDFTQTPSQNVTAYAKWTVRTVYTVTFVMNGHGTQVPSQSVESGGTATRPSDPAESGYTFKNWYADSALTTLFDFSAAVTSNKTVYAKWKKDTVLNWNGNRNRETYTFTRVDFANFMESENYDYITGGSIEYADDAELKVTGSFPFTGEKLPDTSDLLRVKYSFYDDNQIFSETTLGTFVVSYAELTMKDTQSGLVSSGTLNASSVLSVLQEKAVGVPTTITAGSQAVYEAGLLIRECGLHFEADDSSFTLTSDHVFDSGTDYLEMVNWLLEAASFRDAYPDADGIIQLRSSFSEGSFFEFSNDENSIVYLEIEASNEWQSSPNVVRLLYNTDEDCVAAWARNLSGSKSSLSERGNREITYYEEVSDLGTVASYKDALIAQAEELLREKSSDVEYATFQHAFKPVQLYDTVLLNYDEKSWEGAVTNITVDLSPGTKTQTKLKRELSSAIEIDSDGAIYREEEEND